MEQQNLRDKQFDELKEAIALRVAGRLEEFALKAIQLSLEDYHEGFKTDVRAAEERIAKIRDENDVLRSLIGLTDTDVRHRIIGQAEEVKFLREQVLALKHEQNKLRAENEQLAVRNEQERLGFARCQKEHEEEQKRHGENLDKVRAQIAEQEKKMREKRDEFDREKERVNAELAAVEHKTRGIVNAEAQQVIRSLGVKLRNLSGSVAGAANFLLDVVEKDKEKPPVKQSRVSEHVPDIDTISRGMQELIRVLDTYLSYFETVNVQYERVAFRGFWDELGRKYVKYSQAIKWPAEKQYPPFVTDRKLLLAACDALVQNAVENLPPGGTIAVSGRFTSGSVELTVADTGPGIAPENRDKIFMPFFTTKPGHEGLGLANARRFVHALGGSIQYTPGDKGCVFSVQVPGAGEDRIQIQKPK